MTPKQEEALRDYLQEVIVPLIEEVLVKKLGQAMTFAKKELAEQPAQQEPAPGYCKQCKQYTIEEPLPAQRTWVGLTDEEVTDIWAESSPYYHEDDFARAIEAKLKEKNT